MSAITVPNHPDLAARLCPCIYRHLIETVCQALPPPLIYSPEHRARRDAR